ncbi:hypothetical protein AJ79_01130 [Helicocarpus griseus UAMH5409]|uniref:Uncharacterized protein n=1 Tax=Helicocarpus griseus UAMH5409 TaxID=1447875 RepID=A0A2B7Y8K2_9EURO|nr:hypothetical protein AJ79_01130 [Helicocarpus griseus UAMH5409]
MYSTQTYGVWVLPHHGRIIRIAISIAAFALQVSNNINALRAVRKFNKGEVANQLDDLSSQLEILREILRLLEREEGYNVRELLIQNSWKNYGYIDNVVKRLLRDVRVQSSAKKFSLKSMRAGLSVEAREQIKVLWQKVDLVNGDLLLALELSQHLHRQFQTPEANTILSVEHSQTQTSTCDTVSLIDEQHHGPTVSSATTSSATMTEENTIRMKKCRQFNTTTGCIPYCDCSCHLTQNISGRFWGLQYTPIAVIFRKCNNENCALRRQQWNLRLALSKYGMSWAVPAGLDIFTGTKGYIIRPALSVERIVDYASPGFKVIQNFLRGSTSLENV